LHVNSANIDGVIVADAVKSSWVYTGTLNANQIVSGKISADRIDTTNLKAERIYNTNNPNNYATVGGSYGDMTLYNNNQEFFKIYNNIDGSVTLYCWGQPFMTVRGQDVYFHGNTYGVTAQFA
jgi:hypothetical protein